MNLASSDATRPGGMVLMLDRSIKKMTPEEFKAARKAGPEPANK